MSTQLKRMAVKGQLVKVKNSFKVGWWVLGGTCSSTQVPLFLLLTFLCCLPACLPARLQLGDELKKQMKKKKPAAAAAKPRAKKETAAAAKPKPKAKAAGGAKKATPAKVRVWVGCLLWRLEGGSACHCVCTVCAPGDPLLSLALAPPRAAKPSAGCTATD